jgi:hypothetical protein
MFLELASRSRGSFSSAVSVTQRVEREQFFAYTEDGGSPLYRGGTSLEGQECLREFYQNGIAWNGAKRL